MIQFKKGDRVRRCVPWGYEMKEGTEWIVSEIVNWPHNSGQVIRVEGSSHTWSASFFTLIEEDKPLPSFVKHIPATAAQNVIVEHSISCGGNLVRLYPKGKTITLQGLGDTRLTKSAIKFLGEHLIEVSKWMEE